MIINRRKQIVISGVIGFGMLLSACTSKENKETSAVSNDSAIIVTVAKPFGSEGSSIHISGQVESSQTANISTRVMGYITRLYVKVGDHVNKGQLIAAISNNDMVAKRAQADAMVTEADATLKSAKKDLDRFTALYKQQSASEKELDNMTLQYDAAVSGMESAKQMRNEVNAMLAYTRLIAPFSGTITQKYADAGSMANPGAPIVTIEQSGTYQISAAVPETEISQVNKGEPVTVNINSIHKNFAGKISQINQSSLLTGGQYIIKVDIPEKEKKGLYAGMYADLSIGSAGQPEMQTDAVLVPVSSIVNKDELTGLYTIGSNNTALLRWVRLGKIHGDKIEVLSGLARNEQFIASADGKLFNGAAVKLK